jgi:FtsP/CotA-like multicopper oxidase with cupredoxin domain
VKSTTTLLRIWILCGLFIPVFFINGYKKNINAGSNSFFHTGYGIIRCAAPVKIPTDLEEVTINDNRKAAGEFRNGIYYLNLEIREGYWYPETKERMPVKIKAFAEAGKPLQVPGPLIRVPEGTEIRVSIRNSCTDPIDVYGLVTRLYRPANYKNDATINKGEIKEIGFNAGAAGTFLYTAKDKNDTLTPATVASPFLNSQLYGGFIIDSHIEKPDPKERIFMIGICGNLSNDVIQSKYVINGLTWPYTERLSYRQGEIVNWRVINASVLGHPMHLHGFPFITKSFVFANKDSIIPEDKWAEAVTLTLIPMNRMRISWVPVKEGNWLFHCHLLDHTLPASFYQGNGYEDHSNMTTETHASAGMGGLIMGISVLPDKKYQALHPVNKGPERQLTLLVGNQPKNYYNNLSGKGFQLIEKGKSGSGEYSIPGPPIILTKNQPVAITIINNMKEPTTIHWHGLVVDSYYDGVAGWGNQGQKLAPLIQPGDTFVVHIVPQRAGTYMYHTHMHDQQLLDGLYGALIVEEEGKNFDPETEKLFLISQGGSNLEFTNNWYTGFTNSNYLLNGSNRPNQMILKKGKTYRLRVMNITAQQNSSYTESGSGFFISLKKDGKPVIWKSIDKDGMSYPEKLYEILPADHQRAATGTTHDFEFTPEQTGSYLFEGILDKKVEIAQVIKVTEPY